MLSSIYLAPAVYQGEYQAPGMWQWAAPDTVAVLMALTALMRETAGNIPLRANESHGYDWVSRGQNVGWERFNQPTHSLIQKLFLVQTLCGALGIQQGTRQTGPLSQGRSEHSERHAYLHHARKLFEGQYSAVVRSTSLFCCLLIVWPGANYVSLSLPWFLHP